MLKFLKLYPVNIWTIAISVMIPAIYGLTNRYFIGYMGMESVVVEQSFESLEVLIFDGSIFRNAAFVLIGNCCSELHE